MISLLQSLSFLFVLFLILCAYVGFKTSQGMPSNGLEVNEEDKNKLTTKMAVFMSYILVGFSTIIKYIGDFLQKQSTDKK